MIEEQTLFKRGGNFRLANIPVDDGDKYLRN